MLDAFIGKRKLKDPLSSVLQDVNKISLIKILLHYKIQKTSQNARFFHYQWNHQRGKSKCYKVISQAFSSLL